jgi:hypothetical protein
MDQQPVDYVQWVARGGVNYADSWTFSALRSSEAAPTASISYDGPLTADGSDTGVLVGTDQGLAHWVPTG